MSQVYDSAVEQEFKLNINFSIEGILRGIEDDPSLVALIERITRQQNLKLARRVGNTSGKYAQRQLPQGVLKQTPGTQRVF